MVTRAKNKSYTGTAIAIGAGTGLATGLPGSLIHKAIVQGPTVLA